MRIELDLNKCVGYANCVVEAPDLFDLDDSASQALVLVPEFGPDQREAAEAAMLNCPATAIRLVD